MSGEITQSKRPLVVKKSHTKNRVNYPGDSLEEGAVIGRACWVGSVNILCCHMTRVSFTGSIYKDR